MFVCYVVVECVVGDFDVVCYGCDVVVFCCDFCMYLMIDCFVVFFGRCFYLVYYSSVLMLEC